MLALCGKFLSFYLPTRHDIWPVGRIHAFSRRDSFVSMDEVIGIEGNMGPEMGNIFS